MRFSAKLKTWMAIPLVFSMYASLFMPAVHVEASSEPEPGFFEDHFNRSVINEKWQVVDGSWSTEDGSMTAESGLGSKALIKETELQDGSIEGDISFPERKGDAGFLLRTISATPGADNVKGYYAGISAQGTGSVFLGRMDNKWTELKRASIPVNPGTVYRFKVSAVGSQIKFYVNGSLVLEQTDTTYTKGQAGVRLYQAKPTYDNVRIADDKGVERFVDAFDSPAVSLALPNWQMVKGSWKLQAGGTTVNAGPMQAMLVKDTVFHDFTVETDISLQAAAGAAGLLFRSQPERKGDQTTGYYVGLQGDGNLVLSRYNEERTELKSVRVLDALTPSQSYQLKVVTYGHGIKVFLDDMHSPVLEFRDDSQRKLASGGIGVWADNVQPVFDNFIATDYAVPVESFKEPVANKSPLAQTPFVPLPLGSVKADGWLLTQLELMKEGATGYAEDLYGELNTNSEWLGGTAPESNWERPVYYVKGLIALAYTLDDPDLIAKSQKWVSWILASQREDGFFGPASDNDWWPRMVALYVLKDYYEATDDERVLSFLTNYFRYQLNNLDQRPLRDWGQVRSGDNLNVVLWLYNRTEDPFLIQLAEKLHTQGTDTTDVFTNNNFLTSAKSNPDNFYTQHTVNVNQSIKTSAIYSQVSNNEVDKLAFQAGNQHLDQLHNQITGMNSGTEMLAGLSSTQGVELCAIVERVHSNAVAAMITGDPKIGDALEKITFNSLPGAMSKDLKTHQYYSLPNQVQSGVTDHGFKQNYGNGTVQSPYSGFPCCRFNMHMGWPYFVKDMWAGTSDGGLGVIAYGPSRVSASIKGTNVTVKETTNYPFEDEIRFTIEEASESVAFPLKLRIPEWTDNAVVIVNGQPQAAVKSGQYFTIDRQWEKGDTVTLTLPMKIKASTWVNHSIGIERGPLVFSLKIEENWVEKANPAPQVKASGFKEYAIDAKSPWNYGLLIDREHPEASIEVVTSAMPDNPFLQETTPIKLIAKGKRIPAWGKAPNGVSAAEPPVGPVYSAEATEEITLVPFGAENLRVTYFPEATEDPSAIPAKYEAEQAKLFKAAVRANNAYASGSSYVGGMDYADSYASFEQVEAPAAGTYKMFVWYGQNTGNYQPATAKIIVNGGEEQALQLAGTINWGRFMATSINVELQEGANTITFMRGSGASPGFYELDYIALSAISDEPEEPAFDPTAAWIGTASLASGEEAAFTLAVQGVTDSVYQSVYAQDVTVTFDPSKLSFSDVASLREGLSVLEPKLLEPGKIRILAFGEGVAMTPNEAWLKLSFQAAVLEEAADTVITVAEMSLANGEGRELPIAGAQHAVHIAAAAVDKTALIEAIAAAQAIHDEAMTGTQPGQYPAAVKQQLQAAIDKAKLIADDKQATHSQIGAAILQISEALDIFRSGVIKPTDGDLNHDNKRSIGDLAIVAAAYGKTSTDSDWVKYRKADLNRDGIVDIEDLALLAAWITG
ncbi:beta-L-arabinofuranosidase domain-containing protein [Paenibacillus paridis]|uniref:beta-L-arabinofuranosidase domain-containing protein n=1 Tax=Paenibacillus paridis TaxID=2583376 RepID=UPI00111FD85B|nr:beta-L-arabinofuranosidase domain-containing protein [Paenibacillus paridis]